MNILGAVVAILDDTRLLVRLDAYSTPGKELTVFAPVEKNELKDLGLERLLIPKGRIRIDVQQNDQIYIASRFRSLVESGKGSALAPLEFVLSSQSSWSASFDTSQSLGVEFNREIGVGDPVGDR
jgi:hypothetical protein